MKKILVKRQIKAGLILSIFLLLIGIQTITGVSSELNFYVTPIVPSSQIEGTTAYFNLNLAPGETETLGLTLVNPTRNPIDISVTAHTAYTNVNGEVEYGRDPEEVDPTLVYELGELIETPGVVTLEPGETREVFMSLILPDDAFEGRLAGGVRIEEVIAEEDTDQQEGVAIENRFSYVIGMVVSNDRSTVTPDLNLLEVFADQLNYRNVFSATIQNFTPTFVNQLEVEAQIREQGNDEILYEAHQTMMQMAPNSHFNFPISLNGDRFRNGEYVLTMTARSGEHSWSWEETFTVDSQTSRELNREDVSIDSSLNLWMILAISLGTLLVLIVIYLIMKQKKMKQQLGHQERSKDENKATE